MASAGAIRAGKAYVELFTDDSRMMRGLKAAQKNLKSWGRAVSMAGVKVGAIGGAIMAPLLASAKVFSNMGDDLAKMSARTGMPVESLSLLAYAADMSGASVSDLETGLRRMQRTIVDGSMGLKSATDALALMGLSVADLTNLAPEDQFKLIADRIDAIVDPTKKAAAAMMIFGRSGTNLLPLIEGGAAGIDALMGRGRGLGLEVSTEDAKAAEEFQDTWTDLQKTFKQVAFTVGSVLAPTLKSGIESLLPYVTGAIKWAKANPEIIVSTMKVAAVLVGLGAALVVAGGAMTALGVAAGAAMTLLAAIGTVLGFIFSPLGIIVTLAAALGGALLYSSGVGARALSWLKDRFADLRGDAEKAFKGISDAMVAGDWALAAQILWLTLKLEWQKGIQTLLTYWYTFKAGFLLIANDAFWGAAKVANAAFAEIQKLWERAFIGMTAFAGEALSTIAKGAEAVARVLDKALPGKAEPREWVFKAKGVGKMLEDISTRRAVGLPLEDARIDARRQAMENTFTALGESGRQGIMQGWGEDLQKAALAVANARAAWEAAIKKAADERAEVEGPEAPPKPPPPKYKPPSAEGLSLASKAIKGEAVGTFQAAAAERMGYGSTAADRTAEATERTAKATEDMARKWDDEQTFE